MEPKLVEQLFISLMFMTLICSWETDSLLLSEPDTCGVMEQKDEGGQQTDSPCGIETQPGQAGLCE